jgi:predicted secreted protein
VTQAFRAQGTNLEVETATPGVFLHIAELRNITPSFTADQLDASNHDTIGAWREWVGGMKTAQINLEGNFLPADPSHDDQTGLWLFFEDGENRAWRLTSPELPGGSTKVRYLFSGVITEYSPNFNSAELASFTGRLMVTGQPTWSLIS